MGSGLMSSGFTAGTILALGTKVAKRPPRGACNLHSDARQHILGEHLSTTADVFCGDGRCSILLNKLLRVLSWIAKLLSLTCGISWSRHKTVVYSCSLQTCSESLSGQNGNEGRCETHLRASVHSMFMAAEHRTRPDHLDWSRRAT